MMSRLVLILLISLPLHQALSPGGIVLLGSLLVVAAYAVLRQRRAGTA